MFLWNKLSYVIKRGSMPIATFTTATLKNFMHQREKFDYFQPEKISTGHYRILISMTRDSV